MAIITALKKLCNSPSILLSHQWDKAAPSADSSGAAGSSRLDSWLMGIAPRLAEAASTSAAIQASGKGEGKGNT